MRGREKPAARVEINRFGTRPEGIWLERQLIANFIRDVFSTINPIGVYFTQDESRILSPDVFYPRYKVSLVNNYPDNLCLRVSDYMIAPNSQEISHVLVTKTNEYTIKNRFYHQHTYLYNQYTIATGFEILYFGLSIDFRFE